VVVDYSVLDLRKPVPKERREPPSIAIQDLEKRFHELALAANDPVRWSDQEVQAALESLPEEFRSVVLLVDVEDLTYEEAAAALGCPIGTVRSRLSRARKALFVSLQEYARRAGYIGATEE